MDTTPFPVDPEDFTETAAERMRRVAWESDRINEALADVAAGRVVDAAAVFAWLDSLGTDHELPMPQSGR